MGNQNKLDRPVSGKKHYLNKPLKNLKNQIIGQLEINHIPEVIIGLKGSGKSTFIRNLLEDYPQHWRLCVITVKKDTDNLTDIIINSFELANSFTNETEKKRYIVSRFKQATQLGLKIIIIIDNAQELSTLQLETLVFFKRTAKLVFVATPKFSKHLNDNADTGLFYRSHMISIGLLEEDDIPKFIKRRLANLAFKGRFPFSSNEIEDIYMISKGNPLLIKLMSNQFLKVNNIPLPELTKNHHTYNEFLQDIDLADYIDVKKIKDVIQLHDKIRNIEPPKNTTKKKKSLTFLHLFIIILMMIFSYNQFFPIEISGTTRKMDDVEQKVEKKIIATDITHLSSSHTNKTPSLFEEKPPPIKSKAELEYDNKYILEKASISQEDTKTIKQNFFSSPAILVKEGLNVKTKQKITNEALKPPLPPTRPEKTNNESAKNNHVLTNEPVKEKFPTKIQSKSLNYQLYNMPGHEWVEKQPDSHYSIQLLGSSDYNKLLNSIKKFNIDLPVAIIKLSRDSEITWYSLIAGSFETSQEAQKALQNLPRLLMKNKPWIRDFASIKKQN